MNNGILSCSLCNVIFSGDPCLKEHIASKRHHKNVIRATMLSSHSSDLKNGIARSQEPSSEDSVDVKEGNSNIVPPQCLKTAIELDVIKSSTNKASVLHCAVCNLHCNGSKSYEEHLASGRHVKKAELYHQSSQNTRVSLNGDKRLMITCDFCDTEVSSQAYVEHLESERHQLARTGNVTCEFYCNLCDLSCSGDIPYKQHIVSKRHCRRQEIVKKI